MPGTAVFLAHQAVANLDWNPNSSHSFSAKYYYQHDPTIAPYAFSSSGFLAALDAGSQVISLSHTQIMKSNLSVTEIFRFHPGEGIQHARSAIHDAQFACACEAATWRWSHPQSAADCTINTSAQSIFPGYYIVRAQHDTYSLRFAPNIGAGALPLVRLPGFSRIASILPPTPSGRWESTRLLRRKLLLHAAEHKG